MERGIFSFKLMVSRAYYIQDNQEHAVNIPYLNFMNDGNVSLEGEDDIGSFSFSGKACDDYLFLEKKYHGKHTVYYAGKLDKNHLHLHYDFEGNYANMLCNVVSGNYNAGIVFDAEVYDLIIGGTEYNIFLAEDDQDDDRKLKGLGIIDNKVFKLSLKKKYGDHGKLKVKYQGEEITYKVMVRDNKIEVESD
jgi:hypothetical protein